MIGEPLEEGRSEAPEPDSPFLRFVFFPVGHGSCTLISLPPEKVGEKRVYGVVDSKHPYARPVIEYMRNPWFPFERPVEASPIPLRFVILTHYHRDHYLGVDHLVGHNGTFSCELFLHPFPPPGAVARRRDVNPKDRERLDRIQANVRNYRPLHLHTRYDGFHRPKATGVEDPTFSVRGLAPCGNTLANMKVWERIADATCANLVSSAVRLQFGRCAVLFGGDVEEREWYGIIEELTAANEIGLLAANLSLAPHHGGTGNAPELWEKVSRCSHWHSRRAPSIAKNRRVSQTLAIISCGGGHPTSPSQSTIKVLLENHSTICCTEPSKCCLERFGSPDASWPCSRLAGQEDPFFQGFVTKYRLPKTAKPRTDYRTGSICVDIHAGRRPQWYRHDGKQANRQPESLDDPACRKAV